MTVARFAALADGIYRINTPIALPGGQAFSCNQVLIVDDEPVLFHTGPRALFELVSEAIGAVMPIDRLCVTSACRTSKPTNAAR